MTATELIRVDPRSIIISDRLRDVDEDIVEAICAVGLRDDLHPIIVRPMYEDGEALRRTELHLVAGGHRLAAALRLQVEKIAVLQKPLDDDQARLVEIEENMIRKDLRGLERAAFLTEWKRIYEDRHPSSRRGAHGHNKGRNENGIFPFSKVAARKLDCSRSIVEKTVSMFSRIPEDVRHRLSGTQIAEKQSDLMFLASLDPSQQRKAVTLVGDGSAKNLKAAVAILDGSTVPAPSAEDRQFNRLVDAWSSASGEARSRFTAYLRETGELEG